MVILQFPKVPQSTTYTYLKTLVEHINELKSKFGIMSYATYHNNYIHNLITTINENLVNINYDLSLITSTKRNWNLYRTEFGLILANGIRKVLLIDKLEHLKTKILSRDLFSSLQRQCHKMSCRIYFHVTSLTL